MVDINNARLELLFPTPVVIAKIDKHKEYKKKFVPLLTEKFKTNSNQSAPWANLCHSWQVPCNNSDLFIWDDQFGKLVFEFLYYLYKYSNQNQIKIASWFNVHDQNMYQDIHQHRESTISGIYYLQLDKNNFPATFINPSTKDLDLVRLPDRCKDLMYNTFPNNLKIEEGDLVLFPSHLEHLVKRSGLKQNLRISYSFNIETFQTI